MSVRHAVCALLVCLLILLGACGEPEPTATPPATPMPPTDTPAPALEQPTEPPEPPAATPTTLPSDTPELPSEVPSETPEPPGATPTVLPADTPVPADTAEPTAGPQGFLLEGVGFSTPESILYDPAGDVYLVANINGDPGAKDGNGFISRVSPDGELVALKWIDGEAEGVTLDAPKGMALSGPMLYVADIDTVRVFDRNTGQPLGEVAVAGAAFLNDVAAATDGTVYVTDSATGLVSVILPDLSSQQFDEVQLEGPNGILAVGDRVLVAVGGPTILELDSGGQTIAEHQVPAGGLDGMVRLDDGMILVSSWQGSAIYSLDPMGGTSELFGGINAPADIGFDAKRSLVLIPYFQDNRIEARPLP